MFGWDVQIFEVYGIKKVEEEKQHWQIECSQDNSQYCCKIAMVGGGAHAKVVCSNTIEQAFSDAMNYVVCAPVEITRINYSGQDTFMKKEDVQTVLQKIGMKGVSVTKNDE